MAVPRMVVIVVMIMVMVVVMISRGCFGFGAAGGRFLAGLFHQYFKIRFGDVFFHEGYRGLQGIKDLIAHDFIVLLFHLVLPLHHALDQRLQEGCIAHGHTAEITQDLLPETRFYFIGADGDIKLFDQFFPDDGPEQVEGKVTIICLDAFVGELRVLGLQPPLQKSIRQVLFVCFEQVVLDVPEQQSF